MAKHPQFELIPDAAIVTTIYKDGSIAQNGKVTGAPLINMLINYTYDAEFGLWHSDKGYDWAYEVREVK